MTLLDTLRRRHACKAYQANTPISPEQLQSVIEAMSLAPTSSGLQPFSILHLQSPEARAAVVEACGSSNKGLTTDCAEVLVLAAWDNYTAQRIDKVYERHIAERPSTLRERYIAYADMLKKNYLAAPQESNYQHCARQAYIALGLGLAAAEQAGLAATPIEGFNPETLDKLLGLQAKHLRSVLVIALGHADPERDWLAGTPKCRRPLSELVVQC